MSHLDRLNAKTRAERDREPITERQLARLTRDLTYVTGLAPEHDPDLPGSLSRIAGRPVNALTELTMGEASKVISALEGFAGAPVSPVETPEEFIEVNGYRYRLDTA
jgi:hypothetical protein